MEEGVGGKKRAERKLPLCEELLWGPNGIAVPANQMRIPL